MIFSELKQANQSEICLDLKTIEVRKEILKVKLSSHKLAILTRE